MIVMDGWGPSHDDDNRHDDVMIWDECPHSYCIIIIIIVPVYEAPHPLHGS